MISLVKPASLMATRWKFMGSASGSGVSTRRKAVSYAAVMTVCNIVVARRQQTTLRLYPSERKASRMFG
jgi:hypothetical protein